MRNIILMKTHKTVEHSFMEVCARIPILFSKPIDLKHMNNASMYVNVGNRKYISIYFAVFSFFKILATSTGAIFQLR